MRRLHRDGVPPRPSGQQDTSPGGQRLPDASVLDARMCGDHGGGHREHQNASASGAGATGQGARIPVRLLHAGHCDVHVRTSAERGATLYARLGGGIPR